ncbi:MAG: UDP-glucose/GDP-mannose dehydrogenase family protein [Nitrospinae bacterium]|nr:UDP-glucose/GDP-mannose dehydrogenase family protein [Nitrospinota bacterium]
MDIGNKTIGVIGNGFVGGAVSRGFLDNGYEVFVYDKDKTKSKNSLPDVLSCDFVFVCLPTPMTDHGGGSVNLSIVLDFFSDVIQKELFSPIYILKSTVPPGATENISNISKGLLKIVHNPEFLTAANAVNDFKKADRTVLGGDKKITNKVSLLYKQAYPKCPIIEMSSGESELVKYAANCFLATKVIYFNLIYKLCESIGLDYELVSKGVMGDSRIGNSHFNVPGPDGDFGFGGTCFPKDINGLIKTMQEESVPHSLLKEAWELNKTIRKNWDWSNNPSAVLEMEIATDD